MSVAGSESAVDVQVVDENIGGMIKFESGGTGSSLGGFTTEEVMAIYPGYPDSLKEAQSQTVDVDLGQRSFTTEEVMAIYPGYLDYLKEAQSQTAGVDISQLPFVPAIYFHP